MRKKYNELLKSWFDFFLVFTIQLNHYAQSLSISKLMPLIDPKLLIAALHQD